MRLMGAFKLHRLSLLKMQARRNTNPMQFKPDLSRTVGHTPLIKLRKASELTGCEILGKAEFMNPGQSVKDRAALGIITDAIAKGDLKPGGTIVEGTAGNTGIGLALVGASMGFKTVIVIPNTQSQEKKDMIRLAGAELVEVPAVPYKNPNNYVKYSARLADALNKTAPNGAIWANQFDNVANRQAHIDSTAPEIWEQTDGKVDGFICAVGSGGTLAGVAHGLRERSNTVKIGLADPGGSALCLGGSSGINVAGAMRMAKELGPGHTIVTILCDYGTRYQSKLFNPEFLREKNLPVPEWLSRAPAETPQVFLDAGT